MKLWFVTEFKASRACEFGGGGDETTESGEEEAEKKMSDTFSYVVILFDGNHRLPEDDKLSLAYSPTRYWSQLHPASNHPDSAEVYLSTHHLHR